MCPVHVMENPHGGLCVRSMFANGACFLENDLDPGGYQPKLGKIQLYGLLINLGWLVCRAKLARNTVSSHEMSYGKCFEISPKIFRPSFCGSQRIPQNSRQTSPQDLPAKNQEQASAVVQVEHIWVWRLPMGELGVSEG